MISNNPEKTGFFPGIAGDCNATRRCYTQPMHEQGNKAGSPADADVTEMDAAAYIFEISRELAGMAERHGLSKVAAALELSKSLAAEALANLAVARQSPATGKAAAGDAA